ncbi:tRNA 2'-phosphotransferase 1-like [Cardiocondyla obscurior]|uniref:tRNA 2'-phosphotransferase 1-like n=1 Tax=Cardiocondyla obscurior TaxID=286306 RepID=UPI0039655D41
MLPENRSKDDVILGRKLSYLLRHAALKEGLNIKPDGFVAVSELLGKSLQRYTVDDIKRVVETNNKKRFTLKTINGVLEIKANQGHSIPEINELSLKVLEHVEFDIVHGTFFKYWMKIKTEGLSRMTRNFIHFAKGSTGLRQNAELFIYINFSKAKENGLVFFESENNIVLCAGNAEGFIKTKYFLKAITRDSQILEFS